MSLEPTDAAARVFAAAFADALEAGLEMSSAEVAELAQRRAGAVAAPAALAHAARVAAEVDAAATEFAVGIRAAAADDAVAAIQDWADVEHATQLLAASLLAIMVRPGMSTVTGVAADARDVVLESRGPLAMSATWHRWPPTSR